ncbi:MAG: NAD(+)--rifampin ADP-ribosyltransferase [Bacteroidetes bacterium]|nr:NAD(+)--rifampin ADP-ribosyltransferase [Bacteroidota bacterium]
MEFSPANPIVQLCLKGMAMEDSDRSNEAKKIFQQAWEDATNDLEKYLAAYYLARHQTEVSDQIHWMKTAIQFALKVNTQTTQSALPTLYNNLANKYKDSGDTEHFNQYSILATESKENFSDPGPFYHGTRADLQIGDHLTPGRNSNFKSEIVMNHIYFTALVNGAGLAAAIAKGDSPERVYIVEPTGSYENDPNVTNQKFPGNPTRSYRSESTLLIVGEANDWVRQSAEEIARWKERLEKINGEIIN